MFTDYIRCMREVIGEAKKGFIKSNISTFRGLR